jgi:radical SAM superfamily enzyme YgiQ (UPF0313 family)
LPLPDRRITARYRARYNYAHHVPGALLKTSYGCPYSCRFCFCVEIAGHQYRRRPIEEVGAELALIVEPNVFIVDDDFLVSRAAVREFCALIDRLGTRKRFICFGRADFIARNEDVIAQFAQRGLDSVFVGIESFKQSDLDQFNKRMSVSVSERAAEVLHRHGVELCGGVIAGPDWGKADFRSLAAWLHRFHINFVNIQPLVPMPHTPIHGDYAGQLLLSPDEHEKWDLTHLAIRPTKLTPTEYYAEILRAYFSTTASVGSLAYIARRAGTRVAWKCLRGSLRVVWHYLRMMAQYKDVEVYHGPPGSENAAHPTHDPRRPGPPGQT